MTNIRVTFGDGSTAVGPLPISNIELQIVPPNPPAGDVWTGNYYAGTGWNPPVLFSETFPGPAIEKNWAAGSPQPSIVPPDNFSALFTLTHMFTAGAWQWKVRSDDGFELAVDGQVVPGLSGLIQQSAGSKEYIGNVTLAAGAHTITVRYMEMGGNAELHVSSPLPFP